GDEVNIDVDLNEQLKSMSKDRPHNLKNAHILSGITKCSLSLLNQMNAIYSDQNSAQVDYEDMLSSAAESTRIISIVNPDIHVMEIDTIDHLAIAKTILPEIKQHNLINHHERKYLLNPGPATISDRVKLAQVIPDICPREMEFNGVVSEIKGAIESMASSKAEDVTAVLFSGSGTASVESMISSTVHGHDHLLIVNQGAYGERMVQIAKVHQLPFTEYKPDPLIKLNLDELDKMIDQNGITHLALVHHETTTGLLNNLNDISVIIKKYNLTFCLDAMSSFGAVTIDMAKHHIHFCAASSNKNIQGTAGIGFVISDRAALNKIKTAPKRTVYLDLYNQYHYSHANHQFQFTPPVQTIYALREALRELIQEGIDKRYHRYQTLWKQLHSCMDRHGFSHLISPEDHGYLITAYLVPDDSSFSFNHFHDYLYRHHITVYPGKIGALNTFRMATIGSLRSVDMDLICEKISAYFKTHPLHSTT
ncbi:MAG: 2-aminoethylphosphonate--pyruvate transaminase, partial [Candidatus Margulisiibacteriota bacterium]